MDQVKRALARIPTLRFFLVVVLGIAILAGLLAFGDPHKVLGLMEHFQRVYLLYFLLLSLGYETLRGSLWYFLLRSLNVPIAPRTAIFTFTVGEVTRDLPVGNFVPDYVLQRARVADFGLASSATLLTTLLEVAVCLSGIVIIGIDDWSWLRPVILVGLFAFGLLLWIFYRWHHAPHKHQPHPRWEWVLRKRVVQQALDQLREFAAGEQTLLQPRVLAIATAIVACYLVMAGFGVYLVILGLGLSLAWYQALVVYFFSIAFAAIVPLPMDFGSVELSGTGALVASGLGAADAVSVMLINRVLSFGAVLVFAGGIFTVLWRDVRAMFQGLSETQPNRGSEDVASQQAGDLA
jgi:uncharacterized protein (TIRG00374 family)